MSKAPVSRLYFPIVLLSAVSGAFLSGCTPIDRNAHTYASAVNTNVYNYVNAPEVNGGAAMIDPEYGMQAEPGVLTGRSLLRLYANRTSYGKHNAREGDWTEYTARDGRAIYLNRYGEISDGLWWVSGNKICFAYGAQEVSSCNFIKPSGSNMQYVQSDGKKEFYATKFVRGDTANLIERAAQISQ